ncbi:hypothetical protein [Alkalihalobacterium alkalinitrilicum]|uniref:hypothetical protein n=1 Tax=Alkalihalobacterium alkalinitrilicum TaxID=427920 RepID=UPI000995B55C|nr:hypothetical protein [Alkalihalobacterium alkalinitrilicum]
MNSIKIPINLDVIWLLFAVGFQRFMEFFVKIVVRVLELTEHLLVQETIEFINKNKLLWEEK